LTGRVDRFGLAQQTAHSARDIARKRKSRSIIEPGRKYVARRLRLKIVGLQPIAGGYRRVRPALERCQ
jgi:hypothetical protein